MYQCIKIFTIWTFQLIDEKKQKPSRKLLNIIIGHLVIPDIWFPDDVTENSFMDILINEYSNIDQMKAELKLFGFAVGFYNSFLFDTYPSFFS